MIDEQTKQRILDVANILDVVSDFVSLRRAGANYTGLCPFHNERRPSFSVSPSKNVCKCFSCGEGGTPVQFVMKHEQLSYWDALRYLAKKYNIEIQEREITDEEREAENERRSLFIINDFAQEFFSHQLHHTPEGQSVALAYFRQRGIRADIIEKFGLGYSPNLKHALSREARQRGYNLERLDTLGLSVRYEGSPEPIDRFRGRIIFPIRNLSGKYVGFGGRIMGNADKTAKYVNSPESPIYSKGNELYGLYWAKGAISKADRVYLVEGYTDVLSMVQAGIDNVVSSSGTALTVAQIRLLRRFTHNVTVLYDGDSAGIRAALRGVDLLLEEGMNVKVVLLPDGEDPDSYARSHSVSELTDYLDKAETDFIHFKIALYQEEMQRDPLKRAELIKDIIHSLALIPDRIRRTVLLQSTSAPLRMSEAVLAEEVNKLRQRGVRAAGSYYSPSPAPAPQQGMAQPNAPAPALFTPQGEPTQPTAQTAPSPQPEIEQYERDLVDLCIAHGNDLMQIQLTQPTDGASHERIHLSHYLWRELEESDVLGELSPLALQILHEAYTLLVNGQGDPGQFFANHQSEAVRRLATDALMTQTIYDQYHPSGQEEGYKGKLPEGVEWDEAKEQEIKQQNKQEIALGHKAERAVNNLLIHIIDRAVGQVQQELILAQRHGKTDELMHLMTELKELNDSRRYYAQKLGERTIKA